MGYRILGLHQSHGVAELTPNDEYNNRLGNNGSFETIEDAEEAYHVAHHFYPRPDPFHTRLEGINPSQLGYRVFISYFIE